MQHAKKYYWDFSALLQHACQGYQDTFMHGYLDLN